MNIKSIAHQIRAAFRHWLYVVDEHSIHSPFFFDFYRRVIRGQTNPGEFTSIEKLRSDLLDNDTTLSGVDLGAGSALLKENQRTLGEIARISVTPRELIELYVRIIREFGSQRIVELGSCLGITTLYLAQLENTQVFTFEGSPALASVSLTNYEFFDKKNIQLIEGNIDSTLPDFLQDPAKINFVLMDANHTYASTLKYFTWLTRRLNEKSVVVIDDIHWSEGMEKAWEELRRHALVYGSIDLFRCGILFFDPALNRQHYVLSMN